MKSRSAFTTLRSKLQLLIEEAMHRYRRESEPHRFRAAQRALRLSRLEERILMSASPMIVMAQVAAVDAGTPDLGPEETASLEPVSQAEPTELIVVDSRVENYSELLDNLSQAETDQTSILILNDSVDGIQQITEWMQQSAIPANHLSAIHFVSHGTSGVFQLGTSLVSVDTLSSLQYRAQFSLWRNCLTADADILIYGCDVTANSSGLRMLEVLSDLTQADVAASSNATGHLQLGGDWNLETTVGNIEARVFVSEHFQRTWTQTLDLNPTGEIQVNSTTSNEQTTSLVSRGSRNAVALADNGNYVVTWSSRNQDLGGFGVYARLFDKNGIALSGEILVNQTTTNDQQWSSVASDASGNFVITWTSTAQDHGGTQGVYFRMFGADGVARSSEVQVNSTIVGYQLQSSISMNRSGQFVIAWQGQGTGDTSGIFFRRYSASGTALDSTERKANATDRGSEISPAVTIDAVGRSVVFWEVNNHLYFQRYNGAGVAVGAETQIDTSYSSGTSGIAAAVDSTGNFTISLRAEGAEAGIWTRTYTADGDLLRDCVQISDGDASSPSIAMVADGSAADGSFLITFEKTGDGDMTGIYAQRFHADGSTDGGQFLVNQSVTGAQIASSVAMTSAIDYVIVWSGASAADPLGVYARQYGNTAPTISAIASQTIDEDTSTGDLAFTIGDVETPASSLTVTATTSNSTLVPTSGIVVSGTGASRTVRVTPAANQNGSSTITLTVSDATTTSSTQFVLTVNPVKDRPIATADSFTLDEDTTLNVTATTTTGLLANDADPDGDTISILDFTRPGDGNLTVTSNGQITYTPNDNFSGSDSFQYVLTDGTEGRTHYWKLDGNATDSVGTSNGTISGGPSVTVGRYGQALKFDAIDDYVRIPDFAYSSEMTVSFWFRLSDNFGTSYQYLYSHGTVANQNSLNVYLVEADTEDGFANNVIRTRIRDGNDTDNPSGLDINAVSLNLIDNQWHQYTLTTQTGIGTRVYIDGVQRAAISSGGNSINPTGPLYLGARNDLDSSRFASAAMDTVQVFDRRLDAAEVSSLHSGGTSVATATFTVTAVNDSPVVTTNSSGIIAEGGTLTIGSSLLNVTDVDQSASQITYTLNTAPGNGQLRLSGTTLNAGSTWTQDDVNSGRLTYVHDGSETTSDLMRFGISDGAGGSITSTTFNFSITPVNDAPVLTAATPSLGSVFTGQTSAPVTVDSLLGATVSDADSGASSGIAVISASGSGTWQYSLNGTTWTSFGTVSSTQALLLRQTDRIRYVAGTTAETPSFAYRAWDQTGTTAGLQGSKFNTTTTGTGGPSPFSSSSNSASMTVTVPNAAPVGVADNYRLAEDTTLTTVNRPGWFDGRWTVRQQITLNNAAGPVLTDTAVLVTVNSSTIDYGQTQNSGQDLRFVDRDGTLLSYEIEEWNESGTSRVWVRVPQIDASSNADFFWMYYGNASATDGQNAAAVWTSQARAIVHMTGTPSDSSAIANEVDLSGTAATAGYIAGARNFNGTSDEISLNSDVDNVFSGGGTVSAWIRPTGWGENNFGRIASKASSTFAGGALGNGWAFQLDATTGALLFENGFSESTGQWLTAAGTISLNIWQHVAVTYDSNSTSSNPRIFINGAEVAVNEIRTPSGTATSDAALDLKIGNHSAASTRTFDGAIDEFRVWTGARSAAQILADHRSATGALISIGTAESGPGGVLANDTDAESNPLTASLVAGPTNSQSFTLNSNGTFTYTPLANFFGTDTFTYQVSDGTSTTGPFTVSIVVTPVNDLPVIISNGGGATATFDVAENTTAVTTVTSTDVDGGTPVYSIIGGSDQARFSISSTTGALTFVSTRDFETPADLNNDNIYSVVVQVSDGNGAIDTQTINVRIVNVNEAPTSMVIPSVLITEDAGQQTLNTSGTFSDPDAGDILTWSVRQTSGANGFFQNLSIGSASGLLSFQTGLNVNGTAQLEITVVDVGHLSKSRTVLVTATPVDDVPVASPASFTGLAGNLLNVAAPGLAGSVQEVDGDPLTFTITRQPDNGTLVLTAGGGFEYRPATGYTGTDSFEYIASDGITLSNAAVVQIVSQLAPSQSGTSGSGSSSTASAASSAAASLVSGSDSGGSATTSEAGSSASTSSQSENTGPAVAPVNAAAQNLSGSADVATDSEEESDEVIAIAESLPAEFFWGQVAFSTTTTTVQIDRINAESDLRALSGSENAEYSSRRTVIRTGSPDLLSGSRQQWIALHDAIFRQFDNLEKDLNRKVGLERQLVGSVGAVTTGLSVGYFVWIVRGGMLLSGLLAQMPAWQMLDPLLVIDDPGKDRDDDGETIGSIVDNQQKTQAPSQQPESSSHSANVITMTDAAGDRP